MEDLPQEMKAARVMEPAQTLEYKMQTIPLPSIRPTEMLLKVGAAGYCHTDTAVPLNVFGGPFPLTGSHEPAGTVVRVGDEVERVGKFKVGDRVMAVNTCKKCGECPECLHYDARYCAKMHMIGLRGSDGAFADYCTVDMEYSAKIPDGMPFEQAAPLSCAGVTVFSSIRLAQERGGLKPGDVLGFVGIGALGMLGVQFAKALGFKVVGADARDGPLELARSVELAPDLLFNTMQTTPQEAAEEVLKIRPEGWTKGPGVDVLINLSSAPEALVYSRHLLRSHALLILTAMPPDSSFPALELIMKQTTVIGTQNGDARDLEGAARLCVEHNIRSEVTTYKLERESMAQMLKDVQKPEWRGKAVVVME